MPSDICYILHSGANLGEQERPAASCSHALFTTPSCAIIFPTVWSRNSNPHNSWRAIIAFLAPRFAGNGKAHSKSCSGSVQRLSSDIRCNFGENLSSGSLPTRCQRRCCTHGSTICDGCCPREGPMDSGDCKHHQTRHQQWEEFIVCPFRESVFLCAPYLPWRLAQIKRMANRVPHYHGTPSAMNCVTCLVMCTDSWQKSLESERESRALCQTARSRAWHRQSVNYL